MKRGDSKVIYNILTNITHNQKLDNRVKSISNFILACGDNVINSFGGKSQIEENIKNELSNATEEKKSIEKISEKITNVVSTDKYYTILGIIIISILIVVGIGYFVFKKHLSKIPIIGKYFQKSLEVENLSGGGSGSGSGSGSVREGRRRRIKIKRLKRRH
jgi:hypothetical protein